MRKAVHLGYLILLGATLVCAQPAADPKARVKAVRDLARQGEDGVAKIAPFLADTDNEVRLEAVKAISDIGGPKTLDALLTAARDNDPEVQIRATDGLVNVYLPGYVKTGLSGTIRRAGTSIRGKFTDTNDQAIDTYVQVRPEVVEALGRLTRGAGSMDGRANAARAVGILRGRAALPDLVDALRSKDDRLMYESLVAIQKIGDPSAAPRMAFLMRDLNERIQVTALETTGILRNREASRDVREAIDHARTPKVKRTGAQSLAMIADPADHPQFITFLADRDDGVRAAGSEGLGRLRNPVDLPTLEKLFAAERAINARLSEAFALAMLGKLDMGDLMPLRYLVSTLNLKSYKNVALAFLLELARDEKVRQAIYPVIARASKDERIGLAAVLGRSGESDSLPYVQTLSMDPDPDVQAEGIRNLRTLRARLP